MAEPVARWLVQSILKQTERMIRPGTQLLTWSETIRPAGIFLSMPDCSNPFAAIVFCLTGLCPSLSPK
ncbi:uncharacterized protein LY79DRAFT_552649 [Colletotrichum navitas]|uniref:Uncharacterized protein n=1 Tax=Colletotrichum navitas TaxID=681940 RepID=A0AAD8V596_9PEZI|nr:uncharacterized protein LY79DRAFT_552649 [Colletotrichum navitas]KAK1593374.1 hypothetical protein LY79DRAFT_552649 [Colletotrichum navitas]